MDLSIIIVNYNTKKLLAQLLDSIDKYPYSGIYEIFVVDNASADGSREYLKKRAGLNIILNNKNEGYAKANNKAIRRTKGSYILLLNPDTCVQENTLNLCMEFMKKHKGIGILGCKVKLAEGGLDLACRRGFPTLKNAFFKFSGLAKVFPENKFFAGYNLTYLDENKNYPVDCVVGAFMLFRKETLDETGLLDEDFFMYGEDIDICYRAKQAYWEVVYYADAEILHYKRASSEKSKKAQIEFFNAMKIYYQKHFADEKHPLVSRFVYFGIWVLCTLHVVFKTN